MRGVVECWPTCLPTGRVTNHIVYRYTKHLPKVCFVLKIRMRVDCMTIVASILSRNFVFPRIVSSFHEFRQKRVFMLEMMASHAVRTANFPNNSIMSGSYRSLRELFLFFYKMNTQLVWPMCYECDYRNMCMTEG